MSVNKSAYLNNSLSSEYSDIADSYIKARRDFHSRIQKYGYTVQHDLDIEMLVNDANRKAIEPSQDQFNALIEGKSEEEKREIAETIFQQYHESDTNEISLRSQKVLEALDREPKKMIDALNASLEKFAVEPSDMDDDEYIKPVFRIINAYRYHREIDRLDLNADNGKLIQLNGMLLFLSDPPEIEYLKYGYECFECDSVNEYSSEPKKCKICGSKNVVFRPEHEMTKSRNFQVASLQKNVEDMIGTPASVNMKIYDSMIGKFVVGDRLNVCGFLDIQKQKNGSLTYMVHVISAYTDEERVLEITEADMEMVEQVSHRDNVLEVLSDMFAPEIIGYASVKKALILQAAGGMNIENTTTRVRGLIHVLLAGDPGKAKSQFLIASRQLMLKNMYVSDASKAGLTASIADVGGHRTMIPGVLVLANNGMACIDELDKMQKEDREGLHTAMEQGKISKSKAGFRVSYEVNTSVLAAANPEHSRFDINKNIPEQLNLEPTLLDRFDYIYWFIDHPQTEDEDFSDAMRMLTRVEIKDDDFLKKYIEVARKINPVLSEDAKKRVAESYASVRKKAPEGISIGIRALHSIRKFSEASARIRLSEEVLEYDVDIAVELLMDSWKQIGYDIDKLLGVSFKTRNAISFLRSFFTTKENATMDEILSFCKDKFIEPDVRDGVERMKRSGEIFEPKLNHFRKIK